MRLLICGFSVRFQAAHHFPKKMASFWRAISARTPVHSHLTANRFQALKPSTHGVHLVHGGTADRRQHRGIRVHREADLRMRKDFLHRLRVNALRRGSHLGECVRHTGARGRLARWTYGLMARVVVRYDEAQAMQTLLRPGASPSQ